MATNSKRDVTLGINVAVDGTASLTELGTKVRGVGDAAGEATPALDRMARELDGLTAATKERRAEESAARSESAAAKRALSEQQTALALLKAETDRATKSTADYEARERALRVAVVDARTALREKQAATTAAAAASTAAASAEGQLAEQIKRTGAAAVVSAREQGTGLEALKGQLSTLRNIALAATGGTFIGSLAREVAETADGYANLAARVRLATGEGAEFDKTFKGIFDIAQRTGVAVEDIGALTTKVIVAGREIGITNAQALQLSESVTQSLILSGATVQETASAAQQLSQALASGKLGGDELKSILEGGPRLAQALAAGLGVSVGALKDLGATGALTSQQVVSALLGQSAALQKEFDSLPLTVGRATGQLANAWTDFIGRTDKATGASHAAAEAIGLVARNLDTLASVLFAAGKAGAAYAALRLAESFIASATAARATAAATAAATGATTAHTAAIAANTAAQAANAAAGATSAATAGRLAAAFSTLKLFSLLGVVTNLREIGTALGEGAAKLMGYGSALEEAERSTRADEAASRANAAAKDALAQSMQQATDRALGLSKEARALVAQFDGLILKGESTADALGKVGKSLDLSDVRGITIAGAALDALALRGKITAQQLKDTLAVALKSEDLARFETQARAAFDGSQQGVRRLAAALEALSDESLKRAGTSAKELKDGFSEAATSAINDVDALTRTLGKLGIKGDDAGRTLATALDKALQAANTERAVQAVIARMEELGKAGLLAGDRLTDGLEKARGKLDSIKGGINSLDEALRLFGLRTKAELQTTADKLGEAYLRVAGNAQVSLQDQATAYVKWRDAALAASGGVESAQVKLQGVMLEGRAAAAGLGASIEQAMQRGARATDAASSAQERYNKLLLSDPDRLVSGSSGLGTLGSGKVDPFKGFTNAKIDSIGDQIRNTPSGGITRTVDTGQAVNKPGEGWYYTTNQYEYTVRGVDAAGRTLPGGWAPLRAPTSGVSGGGTGLPTLGGGGGSSSGNAGAIAIPSNYTVNVTIGGRTTPITTSSKNDADALLSALEAAHAAGGG